MFVGAFVNGGDDGTGDDDRRRDMMGCEKWLKDDGGDHDGDDEGY